MTNPLRSLNHGLCDELNMLRDTTRNFVLKELAPIADQVDRSNDFPHPLWRKMGELGLLGITVDERFGGSAMGYLAHGTPTIASIGPDYVLDVGHRVERDRMGFGLLD